MGGAAYDSPEALFFALEGDRRDPQAELNALFRGLFDLARVGRHLLLGLDRQNGDLFGAEPQGRPGGVHGGVARPDDNRMGTDLSRAVEIDSAEEFHAVNDSVEVLSGDVEAQVAVRAGAKQRRPIALREEFIKGIDCDARADLHAGICDRLYLGVQNGPGESKSVYSGPQHAAGFGQGFEYRDGETAQVQEMGRRKPRRSRAHDRDFFRPFLPFGRVEFCRPPLGLVVGEEPLDVADGYGLVEFAAAAGFLAWVVADPAADAGQGVIFLDNAKGLFEA